MAADDRDYGTGIVDSRYGEGLVRFFQRGDPVHTFNAADSFEFEFPNGFSGKGKLTSQDLGIGMHSWFARMGWRRPGLPNLVIFARHLGLIPKDTSVPKLKAFKHDPGLRTWEIYLRTMGPDWCLEPNRRAADMAVVLFSKGDIVWTELGEREKEGAEGEWDRDE